MTKFRVQDKVLQKSIVIFLIREFPVNTVRVVPVIVSVPKDELCLLVHFDKTLTCDEQTNGQWATAW